MGELSVYSIIASELVMRPEWIIVPVRSIIVMVGIRDRIIVTGLFPQDTMLSHDHRIVITDSLYKGSDHSKFLGMIWRD